LSRGLGQETINYSDFPKLIDGVRNLHYEERIKK